MRIGLTQRMERHEAYDEVRESLDIRWVTMLLSLGYDPIILSSLIPLEQSLHITPCDGFLLTGGPSFGGMDTTPRDGFEYEILKYATAHSIPVLGVCRGFQVMNLFLGGTLIQRPHHVATDHVVELRDHSKVSVNSYHTYGIDKIGSPFIPFAKAEDGSIEGATHETLPWCGVMWHPEREEILSPLSKNLIQTVFCTLSKDI